MGLKFNKLPQAQGLKEYRAIRQVKDLAHPHLLPLHAFWFKDEYGEIMEFGAQGVDSVNLQGRAEELIIAMGLGEMTLSDRLKACRREGSPGIPRGELLNYMEDAAKAIDYLNQPSHSGGGSDRPGIQHCDIKPANLLLVGGAVQVCDFGLAKVVSKGPTQSIGAFTPLYMAPEMLDNQPS